MLLWQVSHKPLWDLGRATRLTRERKSAGTHPTALLHPLGAWLLLRMRPPSPFVYAKLSLMDEE